MFDFVNTGEEEVLEVLCRFPDREFTVSELAEESGKSKSLVSGKVSEFVEKGLVSVESKGNSKFVRFNRSNNQALRVKRLLNLNRFYQSGLVDNLVDFYSYPEAIVLFGSFADGEDTEESDVDVCVVSGKEESFDAGEVLGREVSVTVFNKDEIPDNMLETLANGITVYGFLEVRR
jgi:DNA-binding transcriptional ArsR family regulator